MLPLLNDSSGSESAIFAAEIIATPVKGHAHQLCARFTSSRLFIYSLSQHLHFSLGGPITLACKHTYRSALNQRYLSNSGLVSPLPFTAICLWNSSLSFPFFWINLRWFLSLSLHQNSTCQGHQDLSIARSYNQTSRSILFCLKILKHISPFSLPFEIFSLLILPLACHTHPFISLLSTTKNASDQGHYPWTCIS